jgi:hypothetical protein
MKLIRLLLFLLFGISCSFAQELKTRNVIIITLDGYRWQELFNGAEDRILSTEKYVSNSNAVSEFAEGSAIERRQKLMPFFWNVIAKEGQLYGNRGYGNKVNCANHHLLSYPGYSEMLVGFTDSRVSSNALEINPNPTVLEFIQGHGGFHKKVAAFTTWNAFPYILRESESQLHVNAGGDVAEGNISSVEKRVNEQHNGNKRLDEHTFRYAMEYLKRKRPRVMFLGFDETDQHGHGGRYDEYLKAANRADKMIEELWQWIQSDTTYRNQTTLLITTDHGRGNGKNTWKNHRLLATGSRQIWFAALGPDTPSFGEMKFGAKYYQKQVAKTVAAFLGLQYISKKPAGQIVQTMIGLPDPVNDAVILGRVSAEGDSKDNK